MKKTPKKFASVTVFRTVSFLPAFDFIPPLIEFVTMQCDISPLAAVVALEVSANANITFFSAGNGWWLAGP